MDDPNTVIQLPISNLQKVFILPIYFLMSLLLSLILCKKKKKTSFDSAETTVDQSSSDDNLTVETKPPKIESKATNPESNAKPVTKDPKNAPRHPPVDVGKPPQKGGFIKFIKQMVGTEEEKTEYEKVKTEDIEKEEAKKKLLPPTSPAPSKMLEAVIPQQDGSPLITCPTPPTQQGQAPNAPDETQMKVAPATVENPHIHPVDVNAHKDAISKPELEKKTQTIEEKIKLSDKNKKVQQTSKEKLTDMQKKEEQPPGAAPSHPPPPVPPAPHIIVPTLVVKSFAKKKIKQENVKKEASKTAKHREKIEVIDVK